MAGRLLQLPSLAMAGPTGLCAHHTVAIENELIVATDRVTLQAITLTTPLWSWRNVRAIALRLQIEPTEAEPAALLQAVLAHLDQPLPRPPSFALLLQPPWTRLADYINLAYGAAPVFHPAADLAPYSAGRRGKGLLINDVGGFTRHQKAAHHRAPGNATSWRGCGAQLGLNDYAPQLGWMTYGFGAFDRLIDGGQRLQNATRLDLSLLAHQLLSRAQLQPLQRRHRLAQVEELCAEAPLAG